MKIQDTSLPKFNHADRLGEKESGDAYFPTHWLETKPSAPAHTGVRSTVSNDTRHRPAEVQHIGRLVAKETYFPTH